MPRRHQMGKKKHPRVRTVFLVSLTRGKIQKMNQERRFGSTSGSRIKRYLFNRLFSGVYREYIGCLEVCLEVC